MPTLSIPSVDLEIARIREITKAGRHEEGLTAAQTLAAAAPQNRDALYLVAANRRCLNRITEALETLQKLEHLYPRFSLLYQERGFCFMTLQDAQHAIESFVQAVNINPALTKSWSMLERLYRMSGDKQNARKAAYHVATLGSLPPEVVWAGSLFADRDLSAATNTLRTYLASDGKHIDAYRLLARIERECGALHEAEVLLESALKIAPDHWDLSLDCSRTLLDRQKYLKAREVIDGMLIRETDNKDLLRLLAAACVGLGQYTTAIPIYQQLLAASPGSFDLQVALGHSLKAIGRLREAIESYKAATSAKPSFGDAYWSLANLKTYRFSDNEIARMRAEEDAPAVDPVDRYHLCFALGKAYEDRNEYGESWMFYERGNAFKRAESRYDPEIIETVTRKQIEVCTAEFFAARAGVGAANPDAIFIVGLPRSGSTLIEQIVASHSQVEGTTELPEIPRFVGEMEGPRSEPDYPRYPGILADLELEDFQRLGERYLSETRPYRRTKPFFIDKMPNNFRHIGLIHLMLPNTKIIDVRREPMACCFSNLKQLFASGQEFTYSLEDIARYYRSYVELMRHWDAVLPGRVLRVWYEDVVRDLEANVQRILEFCGLEFEPACVEFYKVHRAVATASSEQVRRPIFRKGLVQWRNYEPWLAPLKSALGNALTGYRQ